MGKFDSLLKTNSSKRKFLYDYTKIYKKGRFANSVDYDYFESVYIQELLEANKKKKQIKFNLEEKVELYGEN